MLPGMKKLSYTERLKKLDLPTLVYINESEGIRYKYLR